MRNPNDKEAWTELAEIYLENQEFEKAAHCYEEIILTCLGGDPNVLMKYAEILYTVGGAENLKTAMKYASFVVCEHDYDLKANLLLLQILRALKGLGKSTDRVKELLKLVPKNIKKIYQAKGQG